jgi:hypothetical protein
MLAVDIKTNNCTIVKFSGDRITLHLGSEIRALSQEADGVLLTRPLVNRHTESALRSALLLYARLSPSRPALNRALY